VPKNTTEFKQDAYDGEFKTKVVLEALRDTMPFNELALKYDANPDQISRWKAECLEKASGIFSDKTSEHKEPKPLRREKKRLERQLRKDGRQRLFRRELK
jgi:transposase-like protein